MAVILCEYDFSVNYNPGRLNVFADALSYRPDFEPASQLDTGITIAAVLTSSDLSLSLLEYIRKSHDQEIVS